MEPVVLAFSGSIASGKTTISREVSRVFQYKIASFGDFVKLEAKQKGLDHSSREVLQELGSTLINQGWRNFCFSVLQKARWEDGEGLVIDGIRHLEGLQMIQEIVHPLRVFLIYISLDEEVRKSRLTEKKINLETLPLIEQHLTELQVRRVILDHADLVVDGSLPVEVLVKDIQDWLSKTA